MNWLSYSVPLLEGAWITVQLTVYSTILGTATAFLFGIGKLSSNWFIKGGRCALSRFSAARLHAGPAVLALFCAACAGAASWVWIWHAACGYGTLALGLNFGAYGQKWCAADTSRTAHPVRSAKALGFLPRHTLWRIALPQAIPK